MRYQLPQGIKDEIARRLRNIDSRSQDGTAIMVQGGPFYGCFLSPHGDAFIETYDLDSAPEVDRGRRAQVTTIVLAAKYDSTFAPLIPQLPQRTPEAMACQVCDGIGWHFDGYVICQHCGGLGWYDPAVFEDDPTETSP